MIHCTEMCAQDLLSREVQEEGAHLSGISGSLRYLDFYFYTLLGVP